MARAASAGKPGTNAAAAAEMIADSIRSKPFDYWRQHLKTMRGQWAPFQSLIDLASDVVDGGRHYGGRVAVALPGRRCLRASESSTQTSSP